MSDNYSEEVINSLSQRIIDLVAGGVDPLSLNAWIGCELSLMGVSMPLEYMEQYIAPKLAELTKDKEESVIVEP